MWYAVLFSLAVGLWAPQNASAGTAIDSGTRTNADTAWIPSRDIADATRAFNRFTSIRPPAITLPNTSSASSVSIQYAGSTLWSTIIDVEVRDTLAYCTMAEGLVILNILDPTAPEWVSQLFLPGTAKRLLKIRGNYAYVAAGYAGLQIVDIRDAAHPVLVGAHDTPYWAKDIEVAGNYAFVSDYTNLLIFDISNPAAPFRVAASHPSFGRAYSSVVHGNYLYLGGDAIRVVDMSDPTTPIVLTNLTPVTAGNVIQVSGDTLYTQSGTSGALYMWDISDPATPVSVGALSVPANPFHMEISDGFYYGTGQQRLTFCSILNPPLFFWENVIWDSLANGLCFTLVDTLMYIADGFAGLKVLKNIDPTVMPSVIGAWATPEFIEHVTISGNLALVRDYSWLTPNSYSVHLVDVSDPAAPVRMGTHNTAGVIYDAEGIDEYVFVADNLAGLQLLDVSDPQIPTVVHEDNTIFAYDLAVVDTLLFVAGAQGLQIFNAVDPLAVTLVGSVGGFGAARLVNVVNELALLFTDSTGMQIVDVGNPTAPMALGSTPAAGVRDIVMAGDYAYAVNVGAFIVFDISDPATPFQVTALPSHDKAFGLEVRGAYAFVADFSVSYENFSGLYVYDITNPAAPTEAGFYKTPGLAWDVALVGSHAFVADEYGFLSLSVDLGTGDVNDDGKLTGADLVWLVNYLYKDGPDPLPNLYEGDVNCDGVVDLIDLIYLGNHIFRAGADPC